MTRPNTRGNVRKPLQSASILSQDKTEIGNSSGSDETTGIENNTLSDDASKPAPTDDDRRLDRDITSASTDETDETASVPCITKSEWNPFKRYWSGASSRPDYGDLQSRGGTMMRRIKDIAAYNPFSPVNTLEGGSSGQQQRQQMAKRAPEAVLSQPQKRQRLDSLDSSVSRERPSSVHSYGTTDQYLIQGSHSRTDPKESHNTLSSVTVVGEYRATEANKGIGGRRSRRKNGSSRSREGSIFAAQRPNSSLTYRNQHSDPIEEDGGDDVVEVTGSDGRQHSRQHTRKMPANSVGFSQLTFAAPDLSESEDDLSQEQSAPKQSGPVVQKHQPTGQGNTSLSKRQIVSDDEDELSGPTFQSAAKKRIIGNGIAKPQTKSDPKKRQEAKMAEKHTANVHEVVAKKGLRVKRACRQREFIYPAGNVMPKDADGASDVDCVLIADPEYSMGLRAVSLVGYKELPTLKWMEPNLAATIHIQWNENSSIVYIKMSLDAKYSRGPLLVLDFNTTREAFTFQQWADETKSHDSRLLIQHAHMEDLEKTFKTTFTTISGYLAKQPAKQADDVKLLIHNAAVRNTAARPLSKQSMIEQISTAASSAPRQSVRSQMRPDFKDNTILGLPPLAVERRLMRTIEPIERPLRSSQTMKRSPTPLLEGWTEQHPDWAENKNWNMPLSYERNTVDKEDIVRLDEGQFLNDSIINFYLKYLHNQLQARNEQQAKKIYIFNSFFHAKLRAKKGCDIDYDGVKNWTAKVDLLSYDYIVVPINESAHWWVAIICNAKALLADGEAEADEPSIIEIESVQAIADGVGGTKVRESSALDDIATDVSHINIRDSDAKSNKSDDQENDAVIPESPVRGDVVNLSSSAKDSASGGTKTQKSSKKRGAPVRRFDPKEPKIITLDSLGSSRSAVVRGLKLYLQAEVKDRRGIDIEPPSFFGMTAKNIPMQDNFTDCGVYLLGYMQKFMEDPDRFARDLLQKVDRDWELNASALRNDIRDLIFDLQKSYQHEQNEIKKAKFKAKKQRSAIKSSSPASRAPTEERGPRSSASASASASAPASRHQTPAKQDRSPARVLEREITPAQQNLRNSPKAQPHRQQQTNMHRPQSSEEKPPGNNTSMIVNVGDSVEIEESSPERSRVLNPNKPALKQSESSQAVYPSIETTAVRSRPSSRGYSSPNDVARHVAHDTGAGFLRLLPNSSPPPKRSTTRESSQDFQLDSRGNWTSRKEGSASRGVRPNPQATPFRRDNTETPTHRWTNQSPYSLGVEGSSRKPVKGSLSNVKAVPSSDGPQETIQID